MAVCARKPAVMPWVIRDNHCRWKRGSADAFALYLVLVVLDERQWRDAAEARGFARHDDLEVARHSVFGDTGLDPDLIQLVASLVTADYSVDRHSGCVVVYARQHQVSSLALDATFRDLRAQDVVVLWVKPSHLSS